MDIYSFMKEYEGIIAMLENNTDSKYSGKIRYIESFYRAELQPGYQPE